MTAQRATTMPGGAKLRATSYARAKSAASSSRKVSAASSRPCKYGPRDSEGRCPKKPKSAAKKKPCKYGARTSEGLCPKKPRASSAPSSASVLDKPIPTKTSTGKASSTTIRKQVTKIGNQVATQAGNKVADTVWDWLRKPENRTALQTGAITALSRLRALAGPVGAILAGAFIGAKIGAYNNAVREQGAQNFASLQIANVTRLAKRALTLKEAKYLRDFHAQQFRDAYDRKLREERSK